MTKFQLNAVKEDLVYEIFESPCVQDMTEFLTKPSVYLLCRDFEIVYVGQSRCLSSRIKAHRKNFEFDSVFSFLVDESNVNSIESVLIMTLKPEHNIADTERSPRKRDLRCLEEIGISVGES